MDTLKQLFQHELADMYYAEQKLVTALDQMAGESTDPSIKRAFAEHKTQTEGHITRLNQVFATLGMKPKGETCYAVEGLIREKEAFSKEKPTPEVLDVYNLGAGAKSERYEISAYQGLIGMASELGMGDAERLLGENLYEEEQALATVKNLAKTAMQSGAIAGAKR